jgi:hypothetical protein
LPSFAANAVDPFLSALSVNVVACPGSMMIDGGTSIIVLSTEVRRTSVGFCTAGSRDAETVMDSPSGTVTGDGLMTKFIAS